MTIRGLVCLVHERTTSPPLSPVRLLEWVCSGLTARRPLRGRAASFAGKGDAEGQQAYSEQERLGLRLFIGKARCFFCHTGPRFTDDEFHNLGLSSIEDLGRISAMNICMAPWPYGTDAYIEPPIDNFMGQPLTALQVNR